MNDESFENSIEKIIKFRSTSKDQVEEINEIIPLDIDFSRYPKSKNILGELSAGAVIIGKDDSQSDTKTKNYEETREEVVSINARKSLKAPVKEYEVAAEEESNGPKIKFADVQPKEKIRPKAERLFVLYHDRMKVLFGDKSVSELRRSGGNDKIVFKGLPSNFFLENYSPQVPLQIFYKPKLESLEDTDHFYRYMGMVAFYVKKAEEFRISIECVDYGTGDGALSIVFRLFDGSGNEIETPKKLSIEL